MTWRLYILGLIVGFSILIGASRSAEGSADHVPLYTVTLTSDRDAEIVRQSGVEAVLRGDNRYLVTGYTAEIEWLRAGGVECHQVHHDFERGDWVLLMHEDPSVKADELSISLSLRDRIVFDGNLIVRREVAKEIADTRLGFKSVDFPSFDVPIMHVGPPVLAVSLPEWELVDTLLSLISKDSVEAYVRRLEEFVTRYTYADSVVAARDWLVEKFNQFGYDAVIDSFEMDGLPYGDYAFNVVADHTGTTASEVLIILCGHFDSIARGTPEFVAPGADDNASGTAFCLEIARVLQGFETPKTIRFICFSGEEQQLLGSAAYVRNHPGLNIEVVINADMIGYTRGGFSDVKLYLMSDTKPHADFVADNMMRYTTIVPNFPGNSGLSDHAPFQQAGYRAMFVHEDIFSPFYHEITDLADNLDFDYMTEIVKGCAAATYNIALMPQVVEGLIVSDPGIGDRLLAEWDEVADSRDFRHEILIGTTSGDYVRSHFVSKGENSFVLDGLEDGRLYYIAARIVIDDTLTSIAVREVTGIPVSLPYPATDITAMPAFRSIELSWERSIHTDIAGYRVLRSIHGVDDFTHVVTVDTNAWADSDIVSDNYYDYSVIAVDSDSNESSPTDVVSSRGAFFDRDLLVVIAPPIGIAADTGVAMSKYRYFLSDIRYDYLLNENQQFPIEELGQYRSIMWINDGFTRVTSSLPALDWVSDFGTNLFICGTFVGGSLGSYSPDWFGSDSSHEVRNNYFVQAAGEDTWPDAVVDSAISSKYNAWGDNPYLLAVRYFHHDPPVSSPIYRYVSIDTGDASHNQPCGLYAEVDSSKFVLLGFPIFHIDDDSGRAMINHVADLFGIPRNVAGDVNDDSRYTLVDCAMMLKVLYWDYPMPNDPNRFDVNNDCVFDIVDVISLLTYLYLGGAPPTYGCIESS